MRKHEKIILKNGVRILLVPMQESETATFVVGAGVGARYEKKTEAGISHFLEHLFFKGTKRRPDKLAISKELDGVGGEFNAFTGINETAYYAKVDAKHLTVAVDVISDIFLNSTFPAVEIEKEKGTIIEELNMYEDDPMRTVGDVFDELLYPENPLGRPVIGNKQTIKSFKQQDFQAYFKKHYTGKNVVVAVAGRFDAAKLKRELRKIFEKLPAGKKNTFIKVKERQTKPVLKIKHKQTDQTHLVLGVRAFHREHAERFALAVLANVLGGSMSSRLFMNVREEQGLAYYVRSIRDAFQECGYYAVHAGVNNEKVVQAVSSIISELSLIKNKGITPEELQRAKDFVRGRLALSLETSDDVAMHYVEQELTHEKIMPLEEYLTKIEAVTLADVQRVARKLFVEKNLNLALIGPHKNSQQLLKLLKI